MRDHERIEELIVVRALGGLDAAEDEALHREMADHGAGCAECARLEREYGELGGRLAFALDPVPPRDGLEDDVAARALGTFGAATRRRAGPGRRSRGGIDVGPLVAVAASVILLAGGWAIGAATSGDAVASLEGARVVAFEGEGGATLTLAYRPGERGVVLLGAGLEPQPENRVYEVWSFRGQTPVRGGCFRPAADGSVFEFLDAEVGETRLMAVTVESASCPVAPTTQPVLVAQLA